MAETFMITGSMGCIGSWVLRNLVDEGVQVVATDLAEDRVRPGLLLSEDELRDNVIWARLDVTDLEAVRETVDRHGVTHIVHLAGLQIPFCAADPSLGAAVNVLGTVNMFEAARISQVSGLSYASSLAVMGPASSYSDLPVRDDVALMPMTHYGVYKVANESTAKVYWQDSQVGSVGLRPYVVYGIGRDQGMTSDLAKAILAATAGKPFHIRFDGPVALQHGSDVAKMFIAAARSGHQGAAACNLRNDVCHVSDFVETLESLAPDCRVSVEPDSPLPYPADLDDSGIRSIIGGVPHTPLAQAIAEDMDRYASLLTAGKIDLGQLDL